MGQFLMHPMDDPSIADARPARQLIVGTARNTHRPASLAWSEIRLAVNG